MAEINGPDLISDEALKRPYDLQDGFDAATKSLLALINTGKELGVSIKGAENIKAVREETEKLTQSQVELQKIEKQIATVQAKNNEEYIKATKALNDAKTAQKEKIALGEKDARQVNAQNSSLKQLEAALEKNRQAFRNMATEEQRASKEGQHLLGIIQNQDTDVKKLNASLGNFKPDVGNYQKAGQAMQTIAPAATSAATGMYNLVKASLAFIATPIGLVLAAVGAALGALMAYFKSSEEGQNRLNKIVAIGSAIFEQFMNVVEGIGEAIYNAFTDPQQAIKDFGNFLVQNIINRFVGFFELIPKLAQAVGKLFKGEFKEAGQIALDAVIKVGLGVEDATSKIGKMIDETVKLVDAGVAYGIKLANLQAEIDRTERKMIVDRAKTNLEVAKLREQAITLEGDAKRKVITEAIELERKLSDEEVRFAKLRLQLTQTKLKANGDDKEALKEVAEAQAAVTDAEKLRYDNTVKFRKQLEALDDEDEKKKEAQLKGIEKNIDNAGKKIIGIFGAPVPTKLFASIETGITKATETATFKTREFIDNLKKGLEDALVIFSDFSAVFGNLLDSLTAKRLQNIDKEEQRLDETTKRRIELAGDNDAAVARIEADAEKRKEQLEKKRIAAQRKAAIFDKATAAVQAAILTAVNIVKVFPNPVLMALAAALGAIQVAAIVTKPIPQFFKGTKSAPGGDAFVGEHGAELMRKPGSDWELTPSVATLMDVPRGTEIVPHGETMRRLAMGALAQNGGSSQSQAQKHDEELIQEMKAVNRNLSKIKPVRTNLVRNGATVYHAIKDSEGHTKLVKGINLGRWF